MPSKKEQSRQIEQLKAELAEKDREIDALLAIIQQSNDIIEELEIVDCELEFEKEKIKEIDVDYQLLWNEVQEYRSQDQRQTNTPSELPSRQPTLLSTEPLNSSYIPSQLYEWTSNPLFLPSQPQYQQQYQQFLQFQQYLQFTQQYQHQSNYYQQQQQYYQQLYSYYQSQQQLQFMRNFHDVDGVRHSHPNMREMTIPPATTQTSPTDSTEFVFPTITDHMEEEFIFHGNSYLKTPKKAFDNNKE